MCMHGEIKLLRREIVTKERKRERGGGRMRKNRETERGSIDFTFCL